MIFFNDLPKHVNGMRVLRCIWREGGDQVQTPTDHFWQHGCWAGWWL